MTNETATVERDILDIDIPAESQAVTVRTEGAVAPAGEGPSVAVQAALAMIEMSKRDGHIDVETLRELRGIAKELRDEERTAWFARDMAELQAELQPVVRSAEAKMINKEGENKGSWFFAPREKIMAMLQPLTSKYGFSLTHNHKPRQGDGGGFEVITTCWHRSGHTIEASFPLPLDTGPGRNNLQSAGSTVEYGEKYNTLSLFNITRKGADNDGVDAGGSPVSREQAANLKKLVDNSGIAEGETDLDRKAAIMGWFRDQLSYDIKAYTEVRQEDYQRLARLLTSLGTQRKEREQKGMSI